MTSSAAGSRAGRPAHAGRGATPEVQGVTTAAAGRSADREARMRVYLVQMLLRTACFVAALFTHGWWQLGFILGAVVLLAIVNLFPFLPLDGGHVAGALWEAVKKGWAKLRGLPDPGPVDVAKALPLAYVVAIAFLGMPLLLLYADIVKPITLFP